MAGVSEVHDPVCGVDPLANKVLLAVDIDLPLHESAMDSHPHVHRSIHLKSLPQVNGAGSGRFYVGKEQQRHTVTRRKWMDFSHGMGRPESGGWFCPPPVRPRQPPPPPPWPTFAGAHVA